MTGLWHWTQPQSYDVTEIKRTGDLGLKRRKKIPRRECITADMTEAWRGQKEPLNVVCGIYGG